MVKSACPRALAAICGILVAGIPFIIILLHVPNRALHIFATSPPALASGKILVPVSQMDGLSLSHHAVSRASPRMVLVAAKPRVYYITGLIAPDECEEVMRLALPYLNRSVTSVTEHNHQAVNPARTSNGMFMVYTRSQTDMALLLTRRVATLTGIPERNFEAMQVLRYEPGQFYKPHPDFFSGAFLRSQAAHGGNRQATIVMFLNTVTNGGHTGFPRLAIKVPPVAGDAVLFFSKNADGSFDDGAWHEAIPPPPGQQKWVGVFWMREEQMR